MVPYYNKPSQLGLKEHYLKIAETADLPIFIYDIPGRSVVNMNDETIIELSLHENIIGIKDATNDLTRPIKLKKTLLIKSSFNYQAKMELNYLICPRWRWSYISYCKCCTKISIFT